MVFDNENRPETRSNQETVADQRRRRPPRGRGDRFRCRHTAFTPTAPQGTVFASVHQFRLRATKTRPGPLPAETGARRRHLAKHQPTTPAATDDGAAGFVAGPRYPEFARPQGTPIGTKSGNTQRTCCALSIAPTRNFTVRSQATTIRTIMTTNSLALPTQSHRNLQKIEKLNRRPCAQGCPLARTNPAPVRHTRVRWTFATPSATMAA